MIYLSITEQSRTMPNNTLPEMIAALAFTGLPEGSDAESEAYLRNWAQSHYHARGMRDRAGVAGHAANVFKYLHLGRADLAAQSIPSVLRRLEAITRVRLNWPPGERTTRIWPR